MLHHRKVPQKLGLYHHCNLSSGVSVGVCGTGRSDRLGRWVLRLSEFPHELVYRKGKHMLVADCMSRNSVTSTGL